MCVHLLRVCTRGVCCFVMLLLLLVLVLTKINMMLTMLLLTPFVPVGSDGAAHDAVFAELKGRFGSNEVCDT